MSTQKLLRAHDGVGDRSDMAVSASISPDEGRPEGRLAVVLACYNRKAMTLRCIGDILNQATDNLQIDIFLFDDGCTDGTGDAVRDAYPEVRIIQGDGTAFWGGGMHGAMSEALRHAYDDFLWLNDDVALKPNALEILYAARGEALSAHGEGPHIVSGAVTDPDTGEVTYAGYRKKYWFSPVRLELVANDPDRLVACDTINGNCVLIPSDVAQRLGPNDPVLVHELGDLDYGYRAGKIGCSIWVAPEPVGTCASNPLRKKATPSGNLRERWARLNTPHGLPFKPWRHFMRRHAGPLGMVELATIYLKRFVG